MTKCSFVAVAVTVISVYHSLVYQAPNCLLLCCWYAGMGDQIEYSLCTVSLIVSRGYKHVPQYHGAKNFYMNNAHIMAHN